MKWLLEKKILKGSVAGETIEYLFMFFFFFSSRQTERVVETEKDKSEKCDAQVLN